MIDITVIIPAYNIADYIGEALESAIRQNPSFARIIVIDDGSTDGTRDVVASFDDPRILYHYQQNQGLGPARNKGIELAETEWLYFMDGDDVLADTMTRFVCDIVENSQSSMDAVFFSAIDFDHATGEELLSSEYFRWSHPGQYSSGKQALLAFIGSGKFPSLPVCAFIYVFRKRLLDIATPLRFLNILHEDEPFTPELLLRAGSTIVTNQVLYCRRVRPHSIMTTSASERNVVGILTAAQWWLSHASGDTEKLFRMQALDLYRRVIRYAARAKLGLPRTLELIAEYTPELSRWASIDYVSSCFSRRLAFDAIGLRSRVFS